MAGFFCAMKRQGENLRSLHARYSKALAAFACKGVKLKATIDGQRFVAYVFEKTFVNTENVLHFDNGDFVVATGTLFYKRQMGRPALEALYRDFSPDRFSFTDFRGHFAVLICRNGELFTFNDYNGMCLLYADEDRSFVSSSFLAAGRACPRRTIADQELYEYLSEGGMFGRRTYFREVIRLNNSFIHRLWPDRGLTRKQIGFQHMDPNLSLQTQVQIVHDSLLDFYRMVKPLLGDSITTALSGGFDSRLTLALMREAGIKPALYVYGKPSDPDVRTSKAVCRAENLPLETFDKSAFPLQIEEFPQKTMEALHFYDGLPVAGVLDNGGELFTRRARARHHRFQINSAVGEIYRNLWMLPDRAMTASTFLKSRYDAIDYCVFTSRFDKRRFFQNLADKIYDLLEMADGKIRRDKLEELYMLMRVSEWMSPAICSNNLFSYSMMPFTEPCYTIPSYTIPMRYKALGYFESQIMKLADPILAAYPSAYKFNFSDPYPLKARVADFVKCNTPAFVRPFLRRRILYRQKQLARPVHLSTECRAAIYGNERLVISDYIDLDRVKDAVVLNRALTAELVINDRYWTDLGTVPALPATVLGKSQVYSRR